MLETKLTTCATVLYQWLLPRVSAGTQFKIDLQDFQAWVSEYREKEYSDREVFDALRQLKELQLIGVSKTEVTLAVKEVDSASLMNAQPATELLPEKRDRFSFNPFLLVILATFGCYIWAWVPIISGSVKTLKQTQTLVSPHPWSVLGEKDN